MKADPYECPGCGDSHCDGSCHDSLPPSQSPRTWYFAWHYEHGTAWHILTTPHDLDTTEGLLAIIDEMKEQHAHTKVVPMYWRELDT